MWLLKTINVGLLQTNNDHKHIVVFYCLRVSAQTEPNY